MVLAILAALAVAPAARARVTLVATDMPELVFLGIPHNEVVSRLALPAPSRAVAIARDGRRGYVAAGGEVVAVDVNMRAESSRSALGAGLGELADIELSPGDETLYAVRGQRLLVLDAATLAARAEIDLRGEGRMLAIGRGGALAAVALRGGRVALVEPGRRALLRRVRVPGAYGVAVSENGTVYVSARGRLRVIPPGASRVRRQAIALPPGAGGGLTLSPGRTRLLVAPRHNGRAGAVVDLRGRSVERLVGGRGPGRGAYYPDASRILFADGGDASVSLVSPFSRERIGFVTLPGTRPRDLVVQPGLALILGSEAADRITGTRQRDRIESLGGDDVVRGGRGRDQLLGGPGDDRLSGGPSSDLIEGGDGDDFMLGGSGDDTVRGGTGNDGADGGTGNDVLHGDEGNDTLDGGDGDDELHGGEGDDSLIEHGFGDDRLLDGGPGDDVVRGGRGSDRLIRGGPGDDRLYGETGAERIIGDEGDDLIDGGRAGDRLEGLLGDDTILGDAGDDHLYGHEGADRLDGGSGADELFGHQGDDTLVGGNGADRFDGGPGDDQIRAADDSADSVDCGPGVDTVYVEQDAPTRDLLSGCEHVVAIPPEPDSDTTAAQTIRGTRHADVLRGTEGADSMFGRGGHDRMYGLGGDDYVDGDQGNDRLHGGSGDDVLAGRRGHDRIWGGPGDDRITGDRGRDLIKGGDGDDRIFGNLDDDTILGGPGDDRINVVRGGADRVVCGPGRDVVFADPSDRIASDCESVRR